jgi:anaerobic magnesium-protoporphyrin IX monomethyl ester cyclase
MLAASVRQKFPDIEIRVFDGQVEPDVKQRILEFHPDLLGVTSTTPQVLDAYSLLDAVKQDSPDVYLVMGGPHATALPDEASAHADCVVVGEGEKAIVHIIKALNGGVLPSKIYVALGIENLDDLPLPAYDLLDMDKYIWNVEGREQYWKATNSGNPYPMLRVITSRGCFFKCCFCSNSKRQTPVRYYSAERMISDIEFQVDKYKLRSLWFDDDDFLTNRKRLSDFTSLFKQHGLDKKLTWACEARVNDITEESVKLLKSGGCIFIFLGIESHSAKSLAYLKRNTVTTETVDKAVRLCHENGLAVCASFIFGSPNETLEEMQETFDWMRTHRDKGLTLCYGGILIVFPGTELYDYAVKEKLVDPQNFDYRMTMTTADPSQTYLVDRAVNPERFKEFLDFVEANMWLYNQVALRNWKALLTRTYRKYLLKHFGDALNVAWRMML